MTNLIYSTSNTRKLLAGKLALVAFACISCMQSFAQLSGTRTIPSANYPTIKVAVDSLNLYGVAGGGGITFNVTAGYTENIAARINMTATGTALDQIIFQKSGAGANPQINAYTGSALANTATPDGMWALVGSDYVTINGINLTDPNTASTTTMMEYGYGLFKGSGTDGANNNTIKNCVITLNRNNTVTAGAPYITSTATGGSIGIAVAASTPTAGTVVTTVTAVSGGSSNNRFYSNTIQNVHVGIALTGFAAAAPFTLSDLGNDVGGTSLSTGNTIINFGGGTSPASACAGVYFSNQWNLNCSYNTVNNNNGSGINHATTIRAIWAFSSSIGASATINNNILTVTGAGTTTINWCIDVEMAQTGANGNIINVNNNSFTNCSYNTSTSGGFFAVYLATAASNVNVNGNTISNWSYSGTGSSPATACIYNNTAGIGTLNINSNSISNVSFTNTGAGTYGIINNATTVTNLNVTGNLISNITRSNSSGTQTAIIVSSPTTGVVSLNTIDGIFNTAVASTSSVTAISSAVSAGSMTYDGNIIRNISTPTTGTLTGISEAGTNALKIFKNNQVYNFSTTAGGAGGATMTGLAMGSGITGLADSIYNNQIYSLNSTGTTGGTGGSITGITSTFGALFLISKNKVYDLSTNSTGGTVTGMSVTPGTASTFTIANNIIGDLRAPALNSTSVFVTGINLSGAGPTYNVYNNTVYLNATSSGTNFSTNALSVNTAAPSLVLRNNILVNNSIPKGTGLSVALRFTTTSLANYNIASNNNVYYCGIPATNRLIFYDATNSDQTLFAFKARVGPTRDAASATENPNFTSTVGSSPSFLHINPFITTVAESGGANVAGVTDDFDGDIRQGNGGYAGTGTAPDIGADEFNGFPVPAMTPPISFGSNSATNNSFNITWADSSIGENSFLVYRSLSIGGPYLLVATIPSTSIVTVGTVYSLPQTGLLGNTTYYYRVTAANATESAPLAGNAATLACGGGLSGTKTIPGNYGTLTAAIADLVLNGMAGPVVLELQSSYTSGSETFPITIGSNIPCLSASNPLTIRPASGVVTPLVITSTNTSATIDINGGNYVTIDGRPGGTGTSKMLSIRNTVNADTATIRLRNEASYNTITYCDVQGQQSTFTNNPITIAVIMIGNTTGSTGNDYNTISYCDVHSTGAATTPVAGIGASNNSVAGSPANNDFITVTHCNIYDFFIATTNTTGIKFDAGVNNSAITFNHIYQTITRTFTAAGVFRFLHLNPNSTAAALTNGSGNVVTDNFFGGNAADGSGVCTITSGTTTSSFLGMDISVGIGAGTTVDRDTMTNISFSSANTTAAGTGTGQFSAIAINFGNISSISNNVIGAFGTGITVINTSASSSPATYGIRMGGGPATTTNVIANNRIGNISASNSATLSTTIWGIVINGGTTNVQLTGNNVGPLTNGVAAATVTSGQIIGIALNNALVSPIVNGNVIHDLSCNYLTTGTGAASSVIGIAILSTSTTNATINNDTIFNLFNSSSSTSLTYGPSVNGIVINGSATGIHNVQKNFIHSFNTPNWNPAGTPTGVPTLGGINILAGTLNATNNMIRLGYDGTGTAITKSIQFLGINKATTAANNFRFNSVFIGGTGVATNGAANSAAFQRTSTGIDSVQNNIFSNVRSNSGAFTTKHYAVKLNAATTMTLNYNAYQSTGTNNNFFGNSGSDVTSYATNWIAGDNNSYSGDPQFINPTGTTATVNLHINPAIATIVEGTGTAIPSVTDDIDNQARGSFSPVDIGADAGNFTAFICSGTPSLTPGTTLASPLSICAGLTSVLTLSEGNQPGYTYQWQSSSTNGGPYSNVTGGSGATTPAYTTGPLTTTTYYICVITCSNGGGSINSLQATVTVNPLPTITVTPPTGSYCNPGSVSLTASGTSSTYVWLPATGLTPTTATAATETANPGTSTTYTVIGTITGTGCTASTTVPVSVGTAPIAVSTSSTPSVICSTGTVVFDVSSLTGGDNLGSGWEYQWTDSSGSVILQAWSSISAYSTTISGIGNTVLRLYVRPVSCPSLTNYGLASVFNGAPAGTATTTNATSCGGNGTLTVQSGSNTTWYANDFSSATLDPSLAQLYGTAPATITGGALQLTPITVSLNGALEVKNPLAINTSALTLDFDFTVSGLQTTTSGADGMSWSYGPDVVPIPSGTSNGVTSCLPENGSGTALKISFDAYSAGSGADAGVYIMYNCTTLNQFSNSPGVLGYNNTLIWKGGASHHMNIVINNAGQLTLKIDATNVFNNVQLPAGYLSTNKSSWKHEFSARTGGVSESHIIDNLNIQYPGATLEYSANGGSSWQPSNVFSLPAGTYNTMVRYAANPSCTGSAGSYTISNINPAPYTVLSSLSTGCVGYQSNLTVSPVFAGATYQWQNSPDNTPGSYSNVGPNSPAYTVTVNSLVYYRCVITCPVAGFADTSSVVTLNIVSNPTVSVAPPSASICGTSANLIASGATNYAWSPSAGLSATTGGIVTATPTLTTTYTVTGTTPGCLSSSTATVAITVPSPPTVINTTATPSVLCTPGTASLNVGTTIGGDVAGGSWEYQWTDGTGTILQAWSATSSYTTATISSAGTYNYRLYIRTTTCPTNINFGTVSVTYGILSGTAVKTNSTGCTGNGTITVSASGAMSNWYSNSFESASLDATSAALYGVASITGGICQLTPAVNSQSGALEVKNPSGINSNSLKVDFDLITIANGSPADGLSWSYGADVVPIPTGTADGAGTTAPENGSGTSLKLAFDAINNTGGCPAGQTNGNLAGVYLMYNCTTLYQGASCPGIYGFVSDLTWTAGANKHVSITINGFGQITVVLGSTTLFNNVQLPPAYLAANKSTWKHEFSARTGGLNEGHQVANLNIQYQDYQYSSNGSGGPWQSSNIFNGMSPATYDVWVRYAANIACTYNVGPLTVLQVLPTAVTTLSNASSFCFSGTLNLSLTPDVQGAVYQWQKSASSSGPWDTIPGATGSTYSSTVSASSTITTYYHCLISCGSTPIPGSPSSALPITIYAPQVLSPVGNSHCGYGSDTLTAAPSIGATLNWYAALTGGSSLTSGSIYVTPVINTTTTYYVAATENSCVSTPRTQVIATATTPAIITLTGTATICQGNPTGLNVTSTDLNYVYSWNPGSLAGATQTVSPTSTTTYTVTASDATNGCVNIGTVTVTVNQRPTINSVTATPNLICGVGDSSQLSVTATPYIPPGGNYTVASTTYSTVACLGNPGPTGDDAYLGNLPIGFSFNYFGTTYSQFAVSTNGNIQLGDGSGTTGNPAYSTVFTATTLPTATVPNNMIALCWADLTASAGNITYGTTGLFPNQQLIICYNNIPWLNGTGNLTGQIILNQGSNTIQLNLTSVAATTGNRVCGVENATGTLGTMAPGRTLGTWTTSNESWIFSPPVPTSLTYSWSPSGALTNSTISNPKGNVTGTTVYIVTVNETGTGCSATGTVSVDVVASPNAVITVPVALPFCDGSSFYVKAGDAGSYSGGYPSGTVYSWDGLPNSPIDSFFVNGPSSFNVVVTLPQGCVDTSANVTLTTTDVPAVIGFGSGLDTVKCHGDLTYAWIEVIFGDVPYLYKWYNSAGNLIKNLVSASSIDSLTGIGAGTYYVVVYDAATAGGSPPMCASDSLQINVYQPAATLLVTQTHTNILCNGNLTGSVNITATGGTSGYDYNWSNSATTEDLSGLGPNTYTVLVTDQHTCTASVSATVTQPPLLVLNGTATQITCNGLLNGAIANVVTGGTIAYTYQWNNGATTQNRSSLGVGTYTVTVKDANNCTTSAVYTITQPTAVVINATIVNVKCFGASDGSVTASATGGTPPYTYSWNTVPVKTTQTITGLPIGVYICTIKDSRNCQKTLSTTVVQPPALAVSFTSTNVSTNGGSNGKATANPSGGVVPYSYLWSNTKITQTISGLTAGTYTVTVTDGKGCTKSGTVVISQPPPRVAPDVLPDDNQISSITVYPNPTSANVTIEAEACCNMKGMIRVFDFEGRLVMQRNIAIVKGSNKQELNIENLSGGMYLVNFMYGDKSKNVRVVKE